MLSMVLSCKWIPDLADIHKVWLNKRYIDYSFLTVFASAYS